MVELVIPMSLVDGDDAMASALLTSFNALIEVATRDRIVPVLRQAVAALLAEEPAPKPSKKNRTRWTGNLEVWAPVRERILARLAARQMTRRELATELGISYPTLQPSLLPHGHAPSRANLARLQGWLDTLEGAADDGGAREAAAPAYRLTAAERERLAAYRALEEERTLRAEVGITGEIIDAVVAGEYLAPKIISRLSGFLAEHQQLPAAG